MTSIGFIGSGTITEAIVRGLKSSDLADWAVLLSPRNAGLSASLAADLPGVTVAPSNQAVVDHVDIVVLAVRPQIAEGVIRQLKFHRDQAVISLIAGLDHHRIADWTGVENLCRAIPLPFVRSRGDAVPVYPPQPQAVQLFDALGGALPVTDRAAFDRFAALSALMGCYFGIIEAAENWAASQGLLRQDSRAYLGKLFCNLGVELQTSALGLAELRERHSTKGGMNEHVFAVFRENGGTDALRHALTSVLNRLVGN